MALAIGPARFERANQRGSSTCAFSSTTATSLRPPLSPPRSGGFPHRESAAERQDLPEQPLHSEASRAASFGRLDRLARHAYPVGELGR